MNSLKSIYDSPLHHPLIAYVAGLFFLVALVRRLPFLYAYLVFFLVTILADATLTGGWSPIPLGTRGYVVSTVVFIILGDFRFFFLVERVARPEASLGRAVAISGSASLVLSIASAVITDGLHLVDPSSRVLWLLYEGAMVVFVPAYFVLRTRDVPIDDESKLWLRRSTTLFAVLYFGWAAADALILGGVDVAHVLRIVPNVLYYAAFLPFVFMTAPEAMRRAPLTSASA